MSIRDFLCREVFICLSVIVLASLLFFVPSTEITAETKDEAIKTRFVFSDLIALDKETGYMWTRDANIKRKGMVWHNTSKFVKDLNKEKYAGYSDWRLPSKKEILTLIDFAEGQGVTHGFAGYFNEIGFKNVEFCCYWSSTTDADNTTFVWVVSVGNNFMSYVNWTIGYYFVWPVRSGQVIDD